jgi:hypothetical protein
MQLAKYYSGGTTRVVPIEEVAVVKRDVSLPILPTPTGLEPVEDKWKTFLRKIFSIRLILPLLSCINIVVFVIIVWVIGYFNNQKSISSVASQLQDDVSQRIYEKTTNAMDLPLYLNEMVYHQISTGKLQLDMEACKTYLTGAFLSSKNIYSLYVGTKYDEFSAFTRYSLGDNTMLTYAQRNSTSSLATETYISNKTADITDEILSEFDYYPTERAWFKIANETRAPSWTDIYFDAFSGVAVITAATPYVNVTDNTTLAVIAVDYDITFLNAFLKTIKLSEHGRAFIIQRNGLLVAASVGDLVDKSSNRLFGYASSDSLVAAASRKLNDSAGLVTCGNENFLLSLDVNYVRDF